MGPAEDLASASPSLLAFFQKITNMRSSRKGALQRSRHSRSRGTIPGTHTMHVRLAGSPRSALSYAAHSGFLSP